METEADPLFVYESKQGDLVDTLVSDIYKILTPDVRRLREKIEMALADSFARGFTEGTVIESTMRNLGQEKIETPVVTNEADSIAIDALFEQLQSTNKRLESLEKTLNLSYDPE